MVQEKPHFLFGTDSESFYLTETPSREELLHKKISAVVLSVPTSEKYYIKDPTTISEGDVVYTDAGDIIKLTAVRFL